MHELHLFFRIMNLLPTEIKLKYLKNCKSILEKITRTKEKPFNNTRGVEIFKFDPISINYIKPWY
jgi:hypothetical protein